MSSVRFEAYVVIADISKMERCDLDNIEQVMPADYHGDEFDWVAEQLDESVGVVDVFPLQDFCDGVNGQELDNLTNSWIGYFYREL